MGQTAKIRFGSHTFDPLKCLIHLSSDSLISISLYYIDLIFNLVQLGTVCERMSQNLLLLLFLLLLLLLLLPHPA